MIIWPSIPRRWLQAPVCKGVGSNPTAVTSREIISHQGMAWSSASRDLQSYAVLREIVQYKMRWDALTGSRTRGTSMGGLYVAATLQLFLRSLMSLGCCVKTLGDGCGCHAKSHGQTSQDRWTLVQSSWNSRMACQYFTEDGAAIKTPRATGVPALAPDPLRLLASTVLMLMTASCADHTK